MAAHLAGVVASETTKPVIGVPIDASPLGGLDALLSTVQMPPGVPVATVAIGKGGALNAAALACQILALSDEKLAKALKSGKKTMAEGVEKKDSKLQEKRTPSA
jgi:phosphoribosylaminoimidazole carboxylase PurE protein